MGLQFAAGAAHRPLQHGEPLDGPCAGGLRIDRVKHVERRADDEIEGWRDLRRE